MDVLSYTNVTMNFFEKLGLKGLTYMIIRKMSGAVELVVLGVIIVCMLVGGFFMVKSDAIDHPVEQAAEEILESQGIDIDFSAGKKENRDKPD